MKERILKIGVILLPFLLYAFFSACNIEIFGDPNEPFPLFRFFLFSCQFFFILGAVSSLRDKEEVTQILKTYLISYFISMAIGYAFFIGYYLKVVPFSLVDRFSVLAQMGWGLLRFSPGSYPNEYGIVSSFVLSVLTLLLCDKSDLFPKRWAQFFFAATFIAFLLATTRAAYMSYAVCFIYLIWKSKIFLKALTLFSIFFTTIFIVLSIFNVEMLTIFTHGFTQKFNEGSLGERYFTWLEAVEQAEMHPFLGAGFASLTNIHNVYLQLIFELGCIGTLVLIVSLLLMAFESFLKYRRPIMDEQSLFFRKIQMVGLINVLSFAASNHNLNHHLTWFVFFLCLASLRLPYLKESVAQMSPLK